MRRALLAGSSPPVLRMRSQRDFSGLLCLSVISTKALTVEFLRPAEVGLYVLMPMARFFFKRGLESA
jgi:hypothetical protein